VSGYEGVNVLIADYDRWSRLCVSGVLSTAGFSVEEASNGMSALRLARDTQPQVVIVGRDLPEIAAPDLVGLLRADPRTRDTAVLQLAPASGDGVDADGTIDLPCMPIELFTSVLQAVAARNSELTAPATAAKVPALATTVRLAVGI
jgi:two-component system, sensor histidine kinase